MKTKKYIFLDDYRIKAAAAMFGAEAVAAWYVINDAFLRSYSLLEPPIKLITVTRIKEEISFLNLSKQDEILKLFEAMDLLKLDDLRISYTSPTSEALIEPQRKSKTNKVIQIVRSGEVIQAVEQPRVIKREIRPEVFLSEMELEKLEQELYPGELNYWLDCLENYATMHPHKWRKYKNHFFVISVWRRRKLENGHTWDHDQELYIKRNNYFRQKNNFEILADEMRDLRNGKFKGDL